MEEHEVPEIRRRTWLVHGLLSLCAAAASLLFPAAKTPQKARPAVRKTDPASLQPVLGNPVLLEQFTGKCPGYAMCFVWPSLRPISWHAQRPGDQVLVIGLDPDGSLGQICMHRVPWEGEPIIASPDSDQGAVRMEWDRCLLRQGRPLSLAMRQVLPELTPPRAG